MNVTSSLPYESNSTWNALYRAAAQSPIFAALRLAAEDIDALARQVADRCVSERSRQQNGTRRAAKRASRKRAGR